VAATAAAAAVSTATAVTAAAASTAAAMLMRVPGDPAYTAKHDGSDDDRRQIKISSQELHHNNALLSARFEKFFT
jgi:Spy/CpxP family protein refolding chaperone